MERKIKVLIVDDSAMIRSLLVEGLGRFPFIEVVGSAPDPILAKEKILRLQPDVLSLDVEMPRMDGLTFLMQMMAEHPMPVIMVSSFTRSGCELTLQCLEAGAVDFVAKPMTGTDGLHAMIEDLADKIKFASRVKIRQRGSGIKSEPLQSAAPLPPRFLDDPIAGMIAIGASTGGTEAIREILERMSGTIPGILVVQHMPEKFTHSFAQRLDKLCPFEVREARDGDRVQPGRVLIAPGNFHMSVRKQGKDLLVELSESPPVNGHRPSVDVLFNSIAKTGRENTIGILLTGMGKDGAQGLLALKKTGARTIAQDEMSCVVFGMPKEAVKIGAAEKIVPLSKIPEEIYAILAGGIPSTATP